MTKKGFTLIELLVVIVIIGILVAIALPNFIKIKDKAKEAEVKQNLHSIQLALERYAVDAPGSTYPITVMGGDWTDSYNVWQSWATTQNLDTSNIPKYLAAQGGETWLAAAQDMGDTLIMEAYMPAYPGNPFIKSKSATLLPKIHHFWNLTGESIEVDRVVGGAESDKMYEVFGPTRHTNLQSIRGDAWVHHIFNNPPYLNSDPFKATTASGPVEWNSPSGNGVLTGNFSYWPRQSDLGLGWPFVNARTPCVGYTLAGYGSIRTGGQDVYNRNGNYKGRYRTETCDSECPPQSSAIADVPCLCNGPGGAGAPPSIAANDGGSDTLIDGVVITLDSGVDKKSARVDLNTEGS